VDRDGTKYTGLGGGDRRKANGNWGQFTTRKILWGRRSHRAKGVRGTRKENAIQREKELRRPSAAEGGRERTRVKGRGGERKGMRGKDGGVI